MSRCLLCFTSDVGSAKSGRDGRFDIRVRLDTTLFETHTFTVKVQAPENISRTHTWQGRFGFSKEGGFFSF